MVKAHRRPPSVALVLVLLAAVLIAAGCGSSSSSSSSTTASNASTGAGPAGTRRAALRTCLQKQGVTLPQRPQGQRPGQGGFGGGGLGLGGAGGLRSNPKLRTALQKCGFSPPAGGGLRARSPQFRQRLTSFASCMRSNGVNLPPPNTSGSGPVFNTRGLNTADPKFKSAVAKCQSVLRRPGGGPGPGGGPAGAA